MVKIFTVTMPDIGEGVMEGEVIQWLKQVGDSLQQDEPVVIVMTDKATVELPATHPGKLVKQYYQTGQVAIRDKPLYDIEMTEDLPAKAAVEAPSTSLSVPSKKEKSRSNKALAAPTTRKLAKELNLDIDQLVGTGSDGHVTKEDVIKAYGSKQDLPHSSVAIQPLHLTGDNEQSIVGIRHLMAKKMTEAHRMVPQFAYFEQLDATHLIQLRHRFKDAAVEEGISVTYMPFIIKALSLTLKQYPLVNSSVDSVKNTIIVHKQHNIGIAIATDDGLIVPVLKNVQEMSLEEVIRAYDLLRAKALANKLQPVDMKESTITVSNFGVLGQGGQWATPIINYPEVAILGIGRIHKQPVVRNDAVVIRDVLNLSWGFDHRVIDGDLAAHFSHHLSMLLQNPAPLI